MPPVATGVAHAANGEVRVLCVGHTMCCAKTDEAIENRFRNTGPKNQVLDGDPDLPSREVA